MQSRLSLGQVVCVRLLHIQNVNPHFNSSHIKCKNTRNSPEYKSGKAEQEVAGVACGSRILSKHFSIHNEMETFIFFLVVHRCLTNVRSLS